MKRFLLLFLFPLVVGAQALPEKPHRVFDTEMRAYTVGLGTAWVLDTLSTKHAFDGDVTRHEAGLFFNGSRSVPKITAAAAGLDVAAVVVAYEWKKYVSNKYLHPLWRAPMLFSMFCHLGAAKANWSLPNR